MTIRYKIWIKNAETPDEKDFFVLPNDKKKKRKGALINLCFCFLFIALLVAAGLVNQSSSRTAWIFYPYIVLFLPAAYFAFGACAFASLSLAAETGQGRDSLSRKEWEKSLARCKHSGGALLVLSGINALLEIVFIVLHRNDGIMRDFVYLGVLLCIILVCVLYGIYFDRNFSKPVGNSDE